MLFQSGEAYYSPFNLVDLLVNVDNRNIGGADNPASYVAWQEAVAFCEQLTKTERAASRLPQWWEYRLPTEAQWEYACRAATTTAFCFGDDPARLPEFAWFSANAAGRVSHAVGQKRPNDWGLHDMQGNVWEWCEDYFQLDYPGGVDPVDERIGTGRVHRGGSAAGISALECRSAHRGWQFPDYPGGGVGFRVALVPLVSAPTAQMLPGG